MADFWKTDASGRVYGPFTNDPDTSINFSFDVSGWLADAGDALTAGTLAVEPGPGLEVAASEQVGPVLTVRIERDMAVAAAVGARLRFDVQLAASDGQRDSRRYWLVMR